MAVIDFPIPKQRKPGPYPKGRPCVRCGAHLLTVNPGPLCSPCELTLPTEDVERLREQGDSLSEMDIRRLQRERREEFGDAA